MLIEVNHLELEEQGISLGASFEKWKGQYEQIDDVCVIGVRI
jgi:hypothetical protein